MNWPAIIAGLIALALSIGSTLFKDEDWRDAFKCLVAAAAFMGAGWAFLITDWIG